MRFAVHQYTVPGYGNLFGMNTVAMGGLMRLATFVCTPNEGTQVPLLLVDVMAMGKKRAVFIEYYDCTSAGAEMPKLIQVANRYANISDYPEKPAWYLQERTHYSLIKGGTDEAALTQMLKESVCAYVEECSLHAEPDNANREKLKVFADRMVRDGNPSSATLQRVLGKNGAETFFRTHVMPVIFETDSLKN